MNADSSTDKNGKGISFFERYLTVWVALCIGGGIILGKVAPGVAKSLDGMAIYVGDAPVVSIPIALCLFFMMYPIMVKIDFHEVVKAGKTFRPVALTLFINWAIKPFTMYAIASFFLGTLFISFIGTEAVDYVKIPLGEDLRVGDIYGAGEVVLVRSPLYSALATSHGCPRLYWKILSELVPTMYILVPSGLKSIASGSIS